MTDFSVRSDSIDVTQIMDEIRARLQEKRGVDYTEVQIRELASVTLERFLDPKNVRSDLLEHYRRLYESGDDGSQSPVAYFALIKDALYSSSPTLRGRLISRLRRVCRPILKLFFNDLPGFLTGLIGKQGQINALHYELLHNLVVEMTRLAIETKNHQMRIESLEARLDFNERRARALEDVVQYRPGATEPLGARTDDDGEAGGHPHQENDTLRRRRARRRRRP